MALAEGPLVPSEIGRRCRLKTNQITAILAQMQEERLVRPGGRPVDKRTRYYEVTDRLFRIWLQMREEGDQRGTLRWIVEFYKGWYKNDIVTMEKDAIAKERGFERLPAEFPPWSDAVRVAKAPDRDAALSALHPELREAIQLLLN
jgi:DNA-binding MarR family transcriptional regulator